MSFFDFLHDFVYFLEDTWNNIVDFLRETITKIIDSITDWLKKIRGIINPGDIIVTTGKTTTVTSPEKIQEKIEENLKREGINPRKMSNDEKAHLFDQLAMSSSKSKHNVDLTSEERNAVNKTLAKKPQVYTVQ